MFKQDIISQLEDRKEPSTFWQALKMYIIEPDKLSFYIDIINISIQISSFGPYDS